jgi:hypothetical protein
MHDSAKVLLFVSFVRESAVIGSHAIAALPAIATERRLGGAMHNFER